MQCGHHCLMLLQIDFDDRPREQMLLIVTGAIQLLPHGNSHKRGRHVDPAPIWTLTCFSARFDNATVERHLMSD